MRGTSSVSFSTSTAGTGVDVGIGVGVKVAVGAGVDVGIRIGVEVTAGDGCVVLQATKSNKINVELITRINRGDNLLCFITSSQRVS